MDMDVEYYLAVNDPVDVAPFLPPEADQSLAINSSTSSTVGSAEQMEFSMDSVDQSATSAISRLYRKNRKGAFIPSRRDFYRSQHIRALKRSIRLLETGQLPTTGISKLCKIFGDQQNYLRHRALWAKLRKYYLAHSDVLDTKSSTVSGPGSEARALRDEFHQAEEKSFNDKFVRDFFQSQEMRAFNYLFTEFVFAVTAEEMCEKMKNFCCTKADHTDSCIQKWSDLKEWTRKEMLEG